MKIVLRFFLFRAVLSFMSNTFLNLPLIILKKKQYFKKNHKNFNATRFEPATLANRASVITIKPLVLNHHVF